MSGVSHISTRSSVAAALCAAACVATPVDHTARYAGPLDPCTPSVGGPPRGDALPRHAGSELWDPGPFATWNTHPAPGCNENPTAGGGEEEFELYITYPTDTDPSFTGQADAAAGRFGVVIFSHANNDTACNIFERYFSLHEHWASHGFIVVSVDQTDWNCARGTRENIRGRQRTIRAAVDALFELDRDPSSRFYGRLDTDRIVLAGHSRGAGASFLAAREIAAVRGVITLQGIDLTVFGFAGVALPSLPVLGVTAGNDVDLAFPRVDAVEDRLRGPYTWVNVNGGAHALTADTVPLEADDRPGITREVQHNLTEYFSTAFLLATLRDSAQDAVLMDLAGVERATAISAHGAYVRWRAADGDVWIDRFDRTTPTQNDLGGTTEATGFRRAEEVFTYRPDDLAPGRRWAGATALLLESERPATYLTRLDPDGPTDVSATPVLTFRARGPDFGVTAPLEVLFETSTGTTAVPLTAEHRGPLPLANRFQQVVVEVPDPSAPLLAVGLRIRGGGLFVDDLRLTSR